MTWYVKANIVKKKPGRSRAIPFAERLLAGLAVFLLVGLGFRLALRGLGLGFAFLRGLYVSFLGRLRGRGGRLSGRSRLPFGSGRLRLLRLCIGARRESGGNQRDEQLLGHGFS